MKNYILFPFGLAYVAIGSHSRSLLEWEDEGGSSPQFLLEREDGDRSAHSLLEDPAVYGRYEGLGFGSAQSLLADAEVCGRCAADGSPHSLLAEAEVCGRDDEDVFVGLGCGSG